MTVHFQTAHQISALLQAGEISSTEVTKAVLSEIESTDEKINAFISVDHEGALKQAADVDDRRNAGDSLHPFAGIPIALKDVLCVKGGRTTCGSRILSEYVSPYDATSVAHLRASDLVFIGKTNMDEFAMGSSNENSSFGPVLNPKDPTRVPGGSSGGSAAAVAANETILALGSDTGGSVRQPAGYCGVVGLKPTYGRISRYGLIAYASSLDQIGPMTKDVTDAALLLNIVSGYDKKDSTSLNEPIPDFAANLDGTIKGLRIGLAKEHFPDHLDKEIGAAIKHAAKILEKAGAEIVDVELPIAGNPEYCIGTYYLIAMAEASANLSRYDGVKYGYRAEGTDDLIEMYTRSRSEGFGQEVKRRIMLGTYALSTGYYDAYYLKAQKVRTLIRQDFNKAFSSCDLLLSPVAPTTAFPVGAQTRDPLEMYLNDIYTVAVNLAGIPGISVPFTSAEDGLPIGAQLLAPVLAEENLLRAAFALEQSAPVTNTEN
ncbi:MAG: Asp-tRNA(Asn)/Glu-tRNA(Gln) amidotransferase subunit GatA [Candidatus Latescibacterota bacterium]|nr:Asp-tRNA(Asn)/Glu-tRNA(Gln) amidotransferase subunit GatA [Candidatus Latescibacterota bacterium]